MVVCVKSDDTPQYVEFWTGAGVMAGVIWGMRKSFGFGKTAFYAIALGIAANVISNSYYKYIDNGG